ncbi:hypothetical protein BS78_09G050500 [Paspalum vaginatum]|nr:hypothetical protein BS78_09G050500 [Paspalum vaginatum]
MAALQQDHGAKQAAAGGGAGEPKGKRAARSAGVDAGEDGGGSRSKKKGRGSSAPAAAPAPVSAHPESAASSSLEDVTVEDTDFLDCGVCFLPLKRPIFQCDVGHVVCSPCCEKLKAMGKCHLCGVASSTYRRCHAMEQLVGSIRVPCPHAVHGCAARPAYHDRENHRLVCVHAPCHCPGEACSFVGSTDALLDHFIEVHNWPCLTNVTANDRDEYAVLLQDGFNFLLANCHTGNKKQGATTSIQCLLLVTVVRQPYAHIISAHCIDPHAHAAATSDSQRPPSKEMQCLLWYEESLHASNLRRSSQLISHAHFQTSKFRIACTNLSNGLPRPDDCFQFVVPNSVIGEHDKDGIKLTVRIIIK